MSVDWTEYSIGFAGIDPSDELRVIVVSTNESGFQICSYEHRVPHPTEIEISGRPGSVD